MKTLDPDVARVLKRLHYRLHYPLEVILTCVRWYVAYPLRLRHREEMMAERGNYGRTFHSAPLDHQASARAREGDPPPQARSWQELEDGQNLREDPR
jgi:transposase-like protein